MLQYELRDMISIRVKVNISLTVQNTVTVCSKD
jgi:hypothetical protein